MSRFTLKGAAAIIEDHQKSIRELESDVAYLRENGPGWLQDQYAALQKENAALKAELDRERSAREAYQEDYQKVEARAEKAEAELAWWEDHFLVPGDNLVDRLRKAEARVAEYADALCAAHDGRYVSPELLSRAKKEAPRP